MDKIAKILAVFLVMSLMLFVAGCSNSYTQEELDAKLTAAESAYNIELNNKVTEMKEKAAKELEAEKAKLISIEEALKAEQLAKETLQTNYDALSSDAEELTTKIAELEEVDTEEAEAEAVVEAGYVKDELKLGSMYDLELSDRKVSKLFDGEVEFDGDDYDAEETLNIKDVLVAINEEDFKSDAYLSFQENGIKYLYTFESTLNTSEIDEDETLTFNLLGKEVEINDWSATEITFIEGQEFFVEEGNVIDFDGKSIEIKLIDEDSIFVVIGDNSKKIDEDSTKEISGLEIFVESVMENDDGLDFAKIKIGGEVETTIKTGEEYADDSEWNWLITANSIGLVLNTEFDSIDSDEEFKALAYGESLCLPNDYVCVRFDDLSVEDMKEYTLELKAKDGVNYIKVKGDMLNGIEDYDLVYANASGFYDEDFVLIVDNTGTLDLEDTDVSLVLSGTVLKIDTISLDLNFSTLFVYETDPANASITNAFDMDNYEDDFRTSYGIVLNQPEDSLSDEDLTINVPEEQLEVSLTIY